jgi:cobalt/nickel transport system permease protein
MHLPDGVLPLSLTLGGYVASFAIAAVCVSRIRALPDPQREVPRAALLTAAFFVASLVHFPLPPVSVHLVLNGLLGVVLGWFAFPAILVGLFLQAVMFGHGGITTLGVNGLVLGLPALAAFGLFRLRLRYPFLQRHRPTLAIAFLGGALGLGIALLLFTVILLGSLPVHIDAALERKAVLTLILAYIPVIVLEGVLTALLVGFFLKVSPGLLEGR